jgi:hypothetical protein
MTQEIYPLLGKITEQQRAQIKSGPLGRGVSTAAPFNISHGNHLDIRRCFLLTETLLLD